LSNEIFSKTSSFVRVEHEGSDLRKLTHFLICNSNKVHSFGTKMIKGSKINVLKSCKNEITEFLGIFVITIIDKFHKKKIIHEKLTFGMAHHLFRS